MRRRAWFAVIAIAMLAITLADGCGVDFLGTTGSSKPTSPSATTADGGPASIVVTETNF